MGATPPRVLFGCVAENDTKYLTQALRLLQSLRWFGGSLADCDVIVAVVGDCRAPYREEFEALGARVERVERMSDWHGPSNKLRWLELAALDAYDNVVLSDCDVVVLDDLADLIGPAALRAKPADLATLPPEILEALFARAGLTPPSWTLRTSIDAVDMLPYCNSGFLVFHRRVLRPFASRWRALNDWCLAQRDLLGPHEFHCDQASFALALAEFGDDFSPLPIESNFPGHLDPARYPEALRNIVPRVLHYHHRVDGRSGGLAATGLPGVDAAVARFNARLAAAHRSGFSNPVFWDLRYLVEPELGSGIGSRGEYARMKQAWVAAFVAGEPVECMIDFGCGDAEWIASVAMPDYVGVDASHEVVARNRVRHPGRRFIAADLRHSGVQGSHSLCFDVLIHQPTRERYRQLVGAVLASTRRGGLINGFDAEPTLVSDIVFYHEPLADTLRHFDVALRPVGQYRDTTVYHWSHG